MALVDETFTMLRVGLGRLYGELPIDGIALGLVRLDRVSPCPLKFR